jgi:lipopolysaccharide biosynthesis regulator YciM
MEEVLLEEPSHEGALRVLAALYEEQARFYDASKLQHQLGKKRDEDTSWREHHLLVAASQSALGRDDLDSAKQHLKAAQKLHDSAHLFAAAAELAGARGNHRGAKERLRQALVADPSLVPHLLPGLIAAEEGISATEGKPRMRDDLDESRPMAAVDPAALESGGEAKQLAPGETALAPAMASTPAKTSATSRITPATGVPLVPAERPIGSVTERVLVTLAEVEAETGPRL